MSYHLLNNTNDREDEEEGDERGEYPVVDLAQINQRLQHWYSKIKTSSRKHETQEFDKFAQDIHSSVFTPRISPTVSNLAKFSQPSKALTKSEFNEIIDGVRSAIDAGIEPRLVAKGSSGSYFALNRQQLIVGIFKPKNEEPYGQLNPKWTKWLHRNLFPCFFGRSCLIPNLSYISEAAAYVLDNRLQTNIVPPTDVVWLSSSSFNYDYFDRRAHGKGKPLPEKQGSFQVFLQGFQDATEFLREHPWPDRTTNVTTESNKQSRRSWNPCVGDADDGDTLAGLQEELTSTNPSRTQFWSEDLMQSMREELEKLVILDYIMRNTDRGLDNWMLKVSNKVDGSPKIEIVASPSTLQTDIVDRPPSRVSMSRSQTSEPVEEKYMSLGAIDNSLAFPWKHPDEWRSFPWSWLFLPASLIGQPFSARTRQHFLPLLSDPAWWRETTTQLKALFCQDADFQEKMFSKQMAVLKGQAWNVLETLKSGDQGPLELARRPRLHVHTDVLEVPVTVPSKSITMKTPRPKRVEAEEIDLGLVSGTDANSLSHPAPAVTQLNEVLIDNDPVPYVVDTLASDLASSTPQLNYASRRARSSNEAQIGKSSSGRSRGFSLGMKGMYVSNRYDEESDLGDLGYALAIEDEASTKKVVVERLETVKAEAVFSWC